LKKLTSMQALRNDPMAVLYGLFAGSYCFQLVEIPQPMPLWNSHRPWRFHGQLK